MDWSPGSPYCPYWWRKHTRTNFWRKNQRSNGTLARRARSDRRHSGSTRAGFGSPFWRHSDIARHARAQNMQCKYVGWQSPIYCSPSWRHCSCARDTRRPRARSRKAQRGYLDPFWRAAPVASHTHSSGMRLFPKPATQLA